MTNQGIGEYVPTQTLPPPIVLPAAPICLAPPRVFWRTDQTHCFGPPSKGSLEERIEVLEEEIRKLKRDR